MGVGGYKYACSSSLENAKMERKAGGGIEKENIFKDVRKNEDVPISE